MGARQESGINWSLVWSSTQIKTPHISTELTCYREGFGRLTPEVFAKEQFRQTRAQNWNLGDELQDDVEKGVWYADRDISEDEGDNFLTVSQCAFLRQYELIPEGVEVPVGHLYV